MRAARCEAPGTTVTAAGAALHMRPKRVRHGPVLAHETTIDRLPQVTTWPNDGGPFITLPEVYTENPDGPGWQHSNLGMYRVQLAGNQYRTESTKSDCTIRFIVASACIMRRRSAGASR